MNKINIPLVENIITYNYNEFGNEYGDTLVDLKRAYIKQKEVLDKIKEILNKMIYEGYAPSSTGSITLYTATGENSEFGARAKVILELLEEIE